MAARKGSVRKGGDGDGWTCQLCNAKYVDDKSELLECEYCENHFCRKCLTLSAAEYKLMSKRSDLHWYCPPCEEKTIKNLKIEREVESRCREYFAKIESRLEKIEASLDKKADVSQVKEIVDELGKKDAAEGGTSEGNIDEKINEFRESNARKANVIMYNVPETESELAEVRKTKDMEIVEELCNIMDTSPNNVRNAIRLGKINKENDVEKKERPLKVSFDDERHKGQFMKNLKNMASVEERLKRISVVHDMTIKERQQNKELVNEAKELNAKNESGGTKYIVTGPPWERKVVKVKLKN